MHRFIPGLAKLPEKRKISQTEKGQRDCVYDRSKHNRGYIKEWEKEYAWLAYVRLESGEIMHSRPMKAGLVKSLAD